MVMDKDNLGNPENLSQDHEWTSGQTNFQGQLYIPSIKATVFDAVVAKDDENHTIKIRYVKRLWTYFAVGSPDKTKITHFERVVSPEEAMECIKKMLDKRESEIQASLPPIGNPPGFRGRHKFREVVDHGPIPGPSGRQRSISITSSQHTASEEVDYEAKYRAVKQEFLSWTKEWNKVKSREDDLVAHIEYQVSSHCKSLNLRIVCVWYHFLPYTVDNHLRRSLSLHIKPCLSNHHF